MLEAIPASPYHRRLLRLAFLAPELQRAILAGRQPVGLTLKQLLDQRLPLLWTEQIGMFGQSIRLTRVLGDHAALRSLPVPRNRPPCSAHGPPCSAEPPPCSAE